MSFSSFASKSGHRLSHVVRGRGAFRFLAGCLSVLALGCGAWALDNELDEAHAISSLQQGGYVVYLRHADRYKGPKEALNQHSPLEAFADCSVQRNLTPKGREQAQTLGHYFRELNIPVDRIIANAQCRTRDTAMLAFGHVEDLELDPRVYDPNFVKQVLSTPPAPKTNTIIVGNDEQFIKLAGIQLGRADAVVVQPDGKGSFTILAKLELDDWQEAAEPGWW
ncbi:histidine phosphatase family protein [Dongia sp.]|uniref:histidine phosphatase family protein n=1 Tax=Dongia sp. TaxID=1977262 RepID=UPI0035B4ED47